MWWWYGRKGASGFSYYSTAEEVTHGIDGSGLTAIVTGASSGIGAETARVLALRGAHVIMGVRNMGAGEEVKEAIANEVPAAKIDVMELDLSSIASVRKFALDFASLGIPLNLLINNAGIGNHFMLSKDNIELQFATNHLGHFLLTNLLLDTIKKTSRETKREGRIVNVSSEGHRFTYREGIRFDNINDEAGYSSARAYGQSKLANILHANELARRLKEDGAEITANSLHPGAITTNLYRSNSLIMGLVNKLGKYVLKNVQQGAATTCYVALHPQVKGISGEYFADNNLAKASSQATDVELARKLWDFSATLVKK
ncbi:short-chain dehydrogenase TIC 32, chloroplastic-like [Camellia sinensis]|uniref:short-chain dehydrogenase TIC 32, chloroplastic-like n=1 Tax=Camellia sinensis TaxID=4442 RepID=UPI0010369CF6|nr:short-chain dehydrogenase TIC 32, chloroplastic-like [Camellia sinensis]